MAIYRQLTAEPSVGEPKAVLGRWQAFTTLVCNSLQFVWTTGYSAIDSPRFMLYGGQGTTPEPGTLVMFGSGLLGLAGFEPKFALQRSKTRGLWGEMPTRGHGRNVARYGANVSRFTLLPDAKLTSFEGGMAILLRE
jgi:hypothetical protein